MNQGINQKKENRYTVIVLLCIIGMVGVFCQENPQALQTNLQEQLHLSMTKYELIYTVYALPNIILPFFGGYINARIGYSNTLLIFIGIMIVGQTLQAISGFMKSYSTLLIGRFIFGIGTETMFVSHKLAVSHWFDTSERSFAFSIVVSLSVLGSAINSSLTPLIYQKSQNLGVPFTVGIGACCVSFIAALLVNIIEDKEKQRQRSLVLQEERHVYPRRYSLRQHHQHKIKFEDIYTIGKTFWLVGVLVVCTYCSFYSFLKVGNDFMQEMFGYTYEQAGYINSFPFIILAIFGPFVGYLSDKTGKRVEYYIYSTACISTSYMLFIAFNLFQLNGFYPVIPWIFFSVFYILGNTTIWPLLSLVVPYEKFTLGLGVICSGINLGYLTIPLICGIIYDYIDSQSPGHGYYGILAFLAIFIALCLFISTKLIHLDKKPESLTNRTNSLETKQNIS